MGFYGNVADRANEVFKFDRIFSSRYEMDLAAAAGTDNVFAGHFVLVQYDPTGKVHSGDFYAAYIGEDNIAYADEDLTHPLYFTTFSQVSNPTAENWAQYWLHMEENFYIKVPSLDYFNESGEVNYFIPNSNADKDNLTWSNRIIRSKNENNMTTDKYYYCTGANSEGLGLWTPVTNQSFASFSYFENYHIDRLHYAIDNFILGYDSTVWEKVYSGGHGTFQLVAHLNGMMPGIELYADAPSMEPSAPYIDSLSTDALYRIHTPSHWGLQVKAVAADESDVMVLKDNGQWIYGDIYMNLGGSSSNQQNYYHLQTSNKDLDTKNELLLTPTGKSGKVYIDKDGNVTDIDTLELGIHLPVIGNAIDRAYDLIYGINSDQEQSRPRDIEFYSGDSSDSLKINGNSMLGGKTYDLTTIAGNLNTIHNVLGQIVIELDSWPTSTQVKGFSDNYIYKYENNYYRKGITYTPSPIENDEYTFVQQFSVTEDNFHRNKYFYKSGNEYFEATEYDVNLGESGYYLRNINSVRYTLVQLTQFEQGQFFYKEGRNYICDQSTLVPLYPERTYYTNIQDNGGKYFYAQYTNDGSYYTLENDNYIPCYDDEPNVETTYYFLSPNVQNSGRAVRYYFPNCYYYKILNSDNDEFYFADDDHIFNPELNQYYIFTFDTEAKYGYDSSGRVVRYYELLSQQEVDLLSPPDNFSSLYTLINGTYLASNNIGLLPPENGRDPRTTPRIYYTIVPSAYTQGDLYLPNIYYYIDDTGSYIIDTGSWTQDRMYYLINSVDTVINPFYEPDKYWYEYQTNYYQKSETDRMLDNTDYYLKSQLYVYADEMNECPYGYEWNDYAAYIPPSITLCTMSEEASLLRMTDLNDQTSTLFGLLLKFNNLCDYGDETRDTSTIGGMLNTLKDILYSVKTLQPGRLLFVNDFGQIESSTITIDDIKSLLNN